MTTKNDEPPGPPRIEARRRREGRAEIELPLGADVEEAHPERRRRREAGEEERRRRDQRLIDRPGLDEGRVEELAIGLERVVPGREQHDPGKHEREQDRGRRDSDREPPRLVEAPL